MIAPNELRIGNWAIGKPNGNMFMLGDGSAIDHFANESEPIPITPEILEKCGFEKGSIYFYFSKFRIVKINDSNNWLILLSDTYHHLCKLKYLHQLQNLYFALTGEELNYTP